MTKYQEFLQSPEATVALAQFIKKKLAQAEEQKNNDEMYRWVSIYLDLQRTMKTMPNAYSEDSGAV